jgi:hypothetical protein
LFTNLHLSLFGLSFPHFRSFKKLRGGVMSGLPPPVGTHGYRHMK